MFEKIRKIIAEQFELSEDEITLDTNIMEDIGADSLDIVELITTLEDTFGVVVADEDLGNLTTVRQVVEFAERLQA